MRTRKFIAATMAAALTVTAISAYTVSGMPALISAYATDAENTVTVDGGISIPEENGDIGETQDTYENMEKLGDVELEVGKSTTVTIPGTDHYTCVVIFGHGDEYGYDMEGRFIELKEISREDGNTTYEIIPKKPCRGDVCFSPSDNGWDPIACLSVHTPGSDSIDVDLEELGVAGGTQGTGDISETQEAYENMEKLGDVELEVGKSTTVTIPGTDHYTCVVIFGSGDEYEYDMEGEYIELNEIGSEDGNTTYEIIPKKPCRGDVCFSPSDNGWDPIACLSVHTPGEDSVDEEPEEPGDTGETQDTAEPGDTGEKQDTDEPDDAQQTPENAVSRSDDEMAVEESGTESEDRTDILPMTSEVQDSEDSKVAIVAEDAEGNEQDSYTEASAAATGEITSDENAVNLPQTGNNSLKNLLIAVGAFMLTCFGFVAVMKSGVIRRRRDEQ